MKYTCDMIKDIMPLYLDKVCSETSMKAVEEHLNECEECRSYYASLQQTEQIDVYINHEQFEEQQMKSIQQIKKKINKKGRISGIIGIGLGIILMGLILCFPLRTLNLKNPVIDLFIDMICAKVEVYTDINQYESYIGKHAQQKFKGKWGMNESILPEKITEYMKVKDFQFVYYNPWDAQYVTYLTVEYDEKAFEKEKERLKEKGIENYTGYYSVTGAPSGYEVLAMDSDDYLGFIYAITPVSGERSITYVEIVFCNYFLDLDIHEYMPEAYLLKGFDATHGNPYEKEKTKRWKE